MADKKEKEVVVIPNTNPPIVVVPSKPHSTGYQHIRAYEQPC